MSPSADASALNVARRSRELARVCEGEPIDLLVIGGGVTGAGIALDAVSRGLRTVLVEKHDLAFGTSRWSSKLVHGGLRYLATGNVGIARESAVERDILMTRTAPHLSRPLPQLVPLLPGVRGRARALIRAGFLAGDVLRRSAGTGAGVLPRSRTVGRAEALRFAPTISSRGLRGGLLAWDGQLQDDARLVVAIARSAAARGARILTRVAANEVAGDSATLRDTLGGTAFPVRARAVINATGVWASAIDPGIRLRPSRGTHLVFSAEAFGGLNAALTIPIPGQTNRFVFALPAGHDRVYLGLTDEEAPGEVPDVPLPTDGEIDFLLETVNTALGVPLGRDDVIGSFAGLRPLLDIGDGDSADLSRSHAVIRSDSGVITVVGGKLTTYRRMAQDAVDFAIELGALDAGECRTKRLPLVGAASAAQLGSVAAPRRLLARYGTEATAVLAVAGDDRTLLEPVAHGIDVTGAELAFAVSHEGALDADDLLDRRTRIGLVDADRARALPAAKRALEHPIA
ncbi:MAG: glycerol-3-phosphate dehydrogenase/oxidase [Sciscionella sp.]